MFGFLMICVVVGFLYGVWEMYDAKNNPEEYDVDSHEDFERGYYRQRRGMFDNFK